MSNVSIRFLKFYDFLVENKIVKSKRELAKILGISNSTLTEYTEKRTNVGIKSVQTIVQNFEQLNADWLLTGNGEMLKYSSKNAHTPYETAKKSFDLEENKHIAHEPQAGFVRESVRNLSGKGHKIQTSDCEKCPEKDRIIGALEGEIEALRDRLNDKDQLIKEKEKNARLLERENTRLQQDTSKQKRRAS